MSLARATMLLGLGLVACGPSFQAVYECDVRFEHCYALDQGAAAGDSKKECWREWLHGYTYGQPRDRVEYAATRFSELSLDPTLPREEVKEARPRLAMRSVVAPVPTDAFKPPPNMIDGHDAGPPPQDPPAPSATAAHEPKAHAPGADCADTCSRRWTTCRAACKDGACDACDRAYRACMPGCFR